METPTLRPSPVAARPERAPSEPTWRVLICGPIAAPGQPAAGGYEAANRRTCDALQRRGLTVLELAYPKSPRGPLRKLVAYGVHFLRAAIRLLRRREDYDLLHLTPLNMHFAWAEALLMVCARWSGKPVLMDVRAGTFVRHYEAGSAWYKSAVDSSLRRATRVAVEGLEYLPFVRRRAARPPFYLPNYIDTPSLQRPVPTRTLDRTQAIRIVYFGRLVPEKGIETALQVLSRLGQRGHVATLTLIGAGPPDYLRTLQQRYGALDVDWAGSLPVDAILSLAGLAHFFLFASRHDGEGHSNALNEAMSVGLVPICSDQGFTRTVVGDAGVVLPRHAEADAYVAAIEGIVRRGDWAAWSERARARVCNLFSEDATIPVLMRIYSEMMTGAAR